MENKTILSTLSFLLLFVLSNQEYGQLVTTKSITEPQDTTRKVSSKTKNSSDDLYFIPERKEKGQIREETQVEKPAKETKMQTEQTWDSILIRRNVIKSRLSFLNRPINLDFSYERVIRPKRTLVFEIDYQNCRSTEETDQGDYKFTSHQKGISFSGQYRFYLSKLKKKFPRGFYVGFALNTSYAHEVIDNMQTSSNHVDYDYSTIISAYSIGLGGNIGFHFLIGDRLSIDVGAIILRNISVHSINTEIRVNNGYNISDNYNFYDYTIASGGGIGFAF